MLSKFKFSILILFLLTHVVIAQQIIICKAYTQNGVPIDVIYSKNISLDQSICILLNAGNKKISGSSVLLHIDQTSGEFRQSQFDKVYRIENGQNWFAANFKFTKEGKFEIYFNDANQKRLASTTIIVGNYKEPGPLPEEPINVNSDSGVEVIFCEQVLSGVPINPKQYVSLKSDGGSVYIYLKNSKPFLTGLLHVVIARKSRYNIDNEEFVASKKYKLDPGWADVFFKYKFLKEGDHKISIYNEREKLIKTAYITVTN